MKHKRAVLRRYPGAFAEHGAGGTWLIWAPQPCSSRWLYTLLLGAGKCKTEAEAWALAASKLDAHQQRA